MKRYDIMSGPLSGHRLPFEPHVLEGEGVLRKIWVQPPFSAKSRGPRCRRVQNFCTERATAKTAIQFPPWCLSRLRNNHNRLPSLLRHPVRFLCRIMVHAQILESCFHESAHPRPPLSSTAAQDVVAEETQSSRFHESAHPRPLPLPDFRGTHCIHSWPPFAEQRDMGGGGCAFNPREAQGPYARRSYRTARKSWMQENSPDILER